jgi:hypothetical protein
MLQEIEFPPVLKRTAHKTQRHFVTAFNLREFSSAWDQVRGRLAEVSFKTGANFS